MPEDTFARAIFRAMLRGMDLEAQLAAARERYERASAALAEKHRGGEWDEYHAANAALLAAERALAAERDEPHAVPLDFPVRWDVGAPMPQVVMNDHHTFLLFLVRTVDPSWDGRSVAVVDPASAQPRALVEFAGCQSARLGGPNDEVFHGHPLEGKGSEPYRAQLVRNSPWLAELRRINSVHPLHRPDVWGDLHHYIFWFHDSTFECLAEGFTVELHTCSVADLLAEACRRLVA